MLSSARGSFCARAPSGVSAGLVRFCVGAGIVGAGVILTSSPASLRSVLTLAIAKIAPASWGEVTQLQRSHLDTDEPFCRMAHRGDDAADQVFAPFVDGDAQPRLFVVALFDLQLVEVRAFAVQCDAALPAFQRLVGGFTGDEDAVDARMSVARMGQAFGEFAVVGEQDEALAVGVQPPNGIEALRKIDQVHHRAAAFGVVGGGDVSRAVCRR